LSSCKNFVSEREKFIFDAFFDLTCVVLSGNFGKDF